MIENQKFEAKIEAVKKNHPMAMRKETKGRQREHECTPVVNPTKITKKDRGMERYGPFSFMVSEGVMAIVFFFWFLVFGLCFI